MPNNQEWMADLKKVIFEVKYAIFGFVQEEIPAQEFPDVEALQDLTSIYYHLWECLENDDPYGDTGQNNDVNYSTFMAMNRLAAFSRLRPNHNITKELNDLFADLREEHPEMFAYTRWDDE